MALWHRKEPFSHLQAWAKRSLIVLHNCVHQYGSALTGEVTCRHVKRAKQKKCGKLRKIAENCGPQFPPPVTCEGGGQKAERAIQPWGGGDFTNCTHLFSSPPFRLIRLFIGH